MIVGYLDLEGKIYNIKGKYVDDFGYYIDEEIIRDYKGVDACVGPGWGWISKSKERLGKGKGRLSLTSKRIIFQRYINPWKKFQWGLYLTLIDVYKANSRKKQNLKEYFELNLDEIQYSKKYGSGNRVFFILTSDGKKFQVDFPKLKAGEIREFVDKYLIE